MWIGERELRARRMRVRGRGTDRWLPFLPDAYFEVVFPGGGVQSCVVEIDMGTLTLRRFARKVEAFEGALEDGVVRRQFKRETFDVLILTHSRGRLETLRREARRAVESDRRHAYLFAPFDALQPAAFAAWQWHDLDGEKYTGVLYE